MTVKELSVSFGIALVLLGIAYCILLYLSSVFIEQHKPITQELVNERYDYTFSYPPGHEFNTPASDRNTNGQHVFVYDTSESGISQAYFGIVSVRDWATPPENLKEKPPYTHAEIYTLSVKKLAEALRAYNDPAQNELLKNNPTCANNSVTDPIKKQFGDNLGYFFTVSDCLVTPVRNTTVQGVDVFVTNNAEGDNYIIWTLPETDVAKSIRESVRFTTP